MVGSEGWSGAALAVASATTPIGTWAPRLAMPIPITVNVEAHTLTDGASNPRTLNGQFLRCVATTNGLSRTFDVDLTAGGATFDIVCDSLSISCVNNVAGASSAPFVSYAISRYADGASWRAPKRTVLVTYANGVAQSFAVPRYSRALTVSKTTSTNFNFELRDPANTVLFTLLAPSSAVISVISTPLPAAVDNINCTPSANAAAMFIFELGV